MQATGPAAGLSAFGSLIANVVRELQWSHFTTTADFDFPGVNQVLRQLAAEATAFLTSAGVPPERQREEFYVEARYPFQERELAVPLDGDSLRDGRGVERLAADFHQMHDKVLGSQDPSQHVECIMWRARAIGLIPQIQFRELEKGSVDARGARKGQRPAYFRELGGMVETSVYEGDELKAGDKVCGPAIIEEKTTTIVVFPGSTATASRFGNYLVEIGHGGDQTLLHFSK